MRRILLFLLCCVLVLVLVACHNKDASDEKEVDVINAVKDKIPVYMFPETIIHLQVMPYNMNGKIDRIELKRIYEQS